MKIASFTRLATVASLFSMFFGIAIPICAAVPPQVLTPPLEAKLVLSKDTYSLAAGQMGEEYRKAIEAAAKAGQPLPTPEVDMSLELKNNSNAPVIITLDSDACRLNLALEGPGGLTVDVLAPMTMEFRMGKPATIDAGKSLTIPIKNLRHGQRGITKATYWTQPGEYRLTASYTSQLPNQESQFTITAPAEKVTVVAAK